MWATKNADNLLNGYKLNLQQLMGMKIPAGILNFLFKHSYCRKGLAKAKASGFKGYTAEEVEESLTSSSNTAIAERDWQRLKHLDSRDILQKRSRKKAKKDLLVLKEMLGEQQFFFGDEPHSLDLVAFCHIAQILNVESEVSCPLRDYMNEECKNLVGLYNRMKDRAWGDHWEEATGDKMDLNPHIPKPEPPVEEKEEEKKETEEAADDNKKEEDKEKGDKDEKEKEEKKEEEEKKE